MDKHKICAILYFISAALLYIAGIISFCNPSGIAMGATNIALGGMFLCLGMIYYKQWKKSLAEEQNKE